MVNIFKHTWSEIRYNIGHLNTCRSSSYSIQGIEKIYVQANKNKKENGKPKSVIQCHIMLGLQKNIKFQMNKETIVNNHWFNFLVNLHDFI